MRASHTKHLTPSLVEDRILAENISMQEACKIMAPKLGVSWHTARQ
ncbi:transposase [Corynebacterium diphtheriae]|nr:transposase [Corynebacterium diphtheriae]OWM45630.1 transposase [Corynebacterium diphtheriae]